MNFLLMALLLNTLINENPSVAIKAFHAAIIHVVILVLLKNNEKQ